MDDVWAGGCERAENARIKEVHTEQQIMMDEYQNEHVSRDLMEATIQAEIEKLNQRRQLQADWAAQRKAEVADKQIQQWSEAILTDTQTFEGAKEEPEATLGPDLAADQPAMQLAHEDTVDEDVGDD
jgi:hypothetical protein